MDGQESSWNQRDLFQNDGEMTDVLDIPILGCRSFVSFH